MTDFSDGRWGAGLRLASLILMAFQGVPIVRGLLLPTMARVNYGAYRNAFVKLTFATIPS
jgi:hypothetical protein